MNTDVVTLELPINVFDKLQKLAAEEQTDPVEIIARLVEDFAPSIAPEQEEDTIFELIGAYYSDRPLIDNIPVSEDPDLYLTAEVMGEQAEGMHAWELAPTRYTQGSDGRPLRRNSDEADT